MVEDCKIKEALQVYRKGIQFITSFTELNAQRSIIEDTEVVAHCAAKTILVQKVLLESQ
jgi:hypothetical protein